MRKPINRTIELAEGIEIRIETNKVNVKKGDKELNKVIPTSKKISVENKDGKIIIKSDKPTKREKELAGTIEGHIRNMIKGLEEPHTYKLEICNVHFPMNVKVDGKRVVIKNFLGEKVDRVAKILEGVEIDHKGNIIELKSSDKDAVGQSAANIEKSTRVRNRDRRVFQDGIYIIEKGGIAI